MKKRNKVIIVLLIIFCLLGVCALYASSHIKTRTLYSLSISKYYKDLNYSIMVIARGKKIDGQDNPQICMNCKEEIKKILDYLNGFELIEISRKKAMKNGFNNDEINNINFNQSREDSRKDSGSDINSVRMLTILFLDNKTLEIVPYYHTTTFKGSKTYIKDYTVVKYYKINNGSIDFNYIEKIINVNALK